MKEKTPPICGYCGEPKENHRGIDLFCRDQYATSYVATESAPDDLDAILSRLIAATDRMAEEIEKIKANL